MKYVPLLLLVSLFIACDEEITVPLLQIDADVELQGTETIPFDALEALEGVYEVVDGKSLLGSEAVVKRTGNSVSIFTDQDAGYCVLSCGSSDSSLLFVGYWRKQTGTETGVFRARIAAEQGGKGLLRGTRGTPGEVFLLGDFGNATNKGLRPVQLVYRRPLYRGPRPFLIVAHRAGGRNSDQLPASENSAELVRLAERFGANGVEIDVQLSADGVPVIYHDEDMNLRLNQKSGLVGSVSDYTIAQLESFVRLKNGERIPTLKRMLATIIRQTSLRFVWLDSKASVPIAMLRDIQRGYQDSARILGRDLAIVIGLPDEDKVQELLRLPDYRDAVVLCELDVETARKTDAEIWAPRWTLGTQNDLVASMQAEGRFAISWTLDQAAYIQQFIKNGRFDGILTNYPSLVAYYYYVQ
ncbi:MAG: glycerophosphodiester phosphodiesterase [Bacteroidetes bacterium]|nr:glycerophosphodiester phosphodiesterase [Bacteroidota bacterium]